MMSGAGTATTFTDTGAGSTTQYSYRVTAFNAAGNSVSQPILAGPAGVAAPAVTVPAPPAAPGDLVGSAIVGTGNRDNVSLTWTDNSLDETGFEIQRSTSPAFTTFATDTVPANTPTWEQANVPRNRTFYYRVRGTNPGGASEWSNVVTVVTP